MAKVVRGQCILQKAVFCDMRDFADVGHFRRIARNAETAEPAAEAVCECFKEKFGRKSA
jgi:hypothetical protein